MTCTCISCDECNGSGTVFRSFTGRYLGNHRCDDLDELETCPECGGSGIDTMCDECREKEEAAEFEEWRKEEEAELFTPRQIEKIKQMIQSALDTGSA